MLNERNVVNIGKQIGLQNLRAEATAWLFASEKKQRPCLTVAIDRAQDGLELRVQVPCFRDSSTFHRRLDGLNVEIPSHPVAVRSSKISSTHCGKPCTACIMEGQTVGRAEQVATCAQ